MSFFGKAGSQVATTFFRRYLHLTALINPVRHFVVSFWNCLLQKMKQKALIH